jgi:hypothetical protein
VFLLRGQDRFAAAAVEHYAGLLKGRGAPVAQVEEVMSQAQAMWEWPVKKMPDPPFHCLCPHCVGGNLHLSDCAVHNGPAMEPGPCDCGASGSMVARMSGALIDEGDQE